jgi:hypothetical protein
LSSKSREFVQKVLEGMQHDKKGTLPVCAGSVLDLLYGNTAQFPPCGLSTAPAAAALRIMRYCFSAVPGFPLAAVCGK